MEIQKYETSKRYYPQIEIIFEYFGLNNQMLKTVEELSELQQELMKYIWKKGNRESIIEEIADVELMIEQIKFGLRLNDDEIDKVKEKKILRTFLRSNIKQ